MTQRMSRGQRGDAGVRSSGRGPSAGRLEGRTGMSEDRKGMGLAGAEFMGRTNK